MRPRHSPIYAFCDREHLAGWLTLCRGVTPIVMPSCLTDAEGSIEGALARLKARGDLKPGNTVVILVPPASDHDRQVDTVRMHVVA